MGAGGVCAASASIAARRQAFREIVLADIDADRAGRAAAKAGSDLMIDGYSFAPTSSICKTIEECLNPPIIWERDRRWFTTAPFSEPETFVFPEGIGPLGCVNVEHELRRLGLDSTKPVMVRGVEVAPRDVVAAVLPNRAELGDRMRARTCAGSLVKGLGLDGAPREAYVYQVVDNEWTMRTFGHQAVVWQTAVHPVVACELITEGVWSGAGVLGPEAFSADPFLDLLQVHGVSWSLEERTPSLA